MRPTAFTGFGLFLRKLRLAKGLSARSVAQMSRGVHRMHGTPISQGYLSLLENGRPTTISLGKLMTLAGIYGASIQEFFSAAPPELRAKLHAEYHRWGEERNVLLDRAPFVDQVRRQLDARLDALFAARARPPVDVPAENPDGARAGLRGVLKVSALPALLCSAGQALPCRFWSARAGQVRDLLALEADVWAL
jgi:transcriptional regulator with XRE-family HTH domain